MFEDLKKMGKDMYQEMIQDAQARSLKTSMNRVNFQIEKKLKDGKVIRANSYNPLLLIKVFKEFEKEAGK